MRKLQDHIFTCNTLLEESEDEIDPDTVSPDNDNNQRESLHMEGTTRANMPVPESVTSYQGDGDTIFPVGETVNHAPVTQNDHVTVDLTHTDSNDNSGNKTVNYIAQEAVAYCKAESITNHVEILRYLQSVIVYGRPLEIQNIEELVEGETNYILVDRNNLLITLFDDISGIHDLCMTLEVQFYNKVKHLKCVILPICKQYK